LLASVQPRPTNRMPPTTKYRTKGRGAGNGAPTLPFRKEMKLMPKKMPTFEAVVNAVWNKHITKLGGLGDEFRTSVWRFLVDRYDLSESEAKALRK